MLISKQKPPHFISEQVWDTMNLREKGFVIMLYSKKHTKAQIKDRLCIDGNRTYQRLKKKCSEYVNMSLK